MKNSDWVKTGILILFAGLIAYMVIAETATATTWIAFFAPVFLAYLFKPDNIKREEDGRAVDSNKVSDDAKSGSDMGSSGLSRVIIGIWNSVVQRQSNRRACAERKRYSISGHAVWSGC